MAELSLYPRFSLAERSRRWKALRELMRKQKIDDSVVVTARGGGRLGKRPHELAVAKG